MSKTHILLLSVNQFHFYFIWFHLRSEGSSRLRIQQKVARLVVPRTAGKKSLINSCFNCWWSNEPLTKKFCLLKDWHIAFSIFILPKNNQEVCTWGQETKCQARVENCRLIWSNLKLKIRYENWKWKSAKVVCWTLKLIY